MDNYQSEFNFTTVDSLFSRMEENLSSYLSNGALDTQRFLPEVKWFLQQLGMAIYLQKEGVLLLEKSRVELPCDFKMLDTCWLLGNNTTEVNDYFQGKYVFYTEKSCETVLNRLCPAISPSPYPYCVDTCHKDQVLEKVTIKEYVSGGNNVLQFNSPTLLRYNNQRSIGTLCSKESQNLFIQNPEEISISKQGESCYLHSTLKNATLYIKYYAFPLDPETSLPLIPNDAIIQKALECHLTHWFLVNTWTNGDEANIENKIKYWQGEKDRYIADAKTLAKMPNFINMVEMTRRVRTRWNSYNLNNNHW